MVWIVGGHVDCSICGKDIATDSDSYVTAPHFIGDHNHPLHRFSDSAMHRSCFVAWEHRPAFQETFNAKQNRHNRQMLDDGSIVALR